MMGKVINFYKKHKILGILLLLMSAIVLHGIVWLIYIQTMYMPHTKGFDKFSTFSYLKYTDDYAYLVKVPGYPSFTGNLDIVLDEHTDLLIWLKAFKDDVYWITIEKDGTTYSIITDSRGNPVSGNPLDTKAIKENKDTVKRLLDAANEQWDLKE